MKSKWLTSSNWLVSLAIACSGSDETNGNDGAAGDAGTGGDVAAAGAGGVGGASGGTSGSGGTGEPSGGTGGISGSAGDSGRLAGAGGGGGTSSGPNPCLSTTWTFTPNAICEAPNPNCNFDETQRLPMYAIDGNPGTRYTSGRQQDGTEEFTLVFISDVTISGITLTTTTSTDAPSLYETQYSSDGVVYMPFVPPIIGSGAPTTSIAFPATTMRAIKVQQTGINDDGWWSINEITINGCVRAN